MTIPSSASPNKVINKSSSLDEDIAEVKLLEAFLRLELAEVKLLEAFLRVEIAEDMLVFLAEFVFIHGR